MSGAHASCSTSSAATRAWTLRRPLRIASRTTPSTARSAIGCSSATEPRCGSRCAPSTRQTPDPRAPPAPASASVVPAGWPLDADKDRVADGIDQCPNTPPGTEVDSTGCQRFKDSDGDGVDDTKDKCPGTPPGSRVDAFGCVILFTPERTPVILRGVTFETGRAVLQLESFTVLNIVAQSLVANPAIRLEIAGYTDGTGAAATNLRLSQARAEVVRAYLVSRGVSPTRMIARGYGASNPIAVNTTPEGRAQNRRVELHQLP